jgi:hypothetical protein
MHCFPPPSQLFLIEQAMVCSIAVLTRTNYAGNAHHWWQILYLRIAGASLMITPQSG